MRLQERRRHRRMPQQQQPCHHSPDSRYKLGTCAQRAPDPRSNWKERAFRSRGARQPVGGPWRGRVETGKTDTCRTIAEFRVRQPPVMARDRCIVRVPYREWLKNSCICIGRDSQAPRLRVLKVRQKEDPPRLERQTRKDQRNRKGKLSQPPAGRARQPSTQSGKMGRPCCIKWVPGPEVHQTRQRSRCPRDGKHGRCGRSRRRRRRRRTRRQRCSQGARQLVCGVREVQEEALLADGRHSPKTPRHPGRDRRRGAVGASKILGNRAEGTRVDRAPRTRKGSGRAQLKLGGQNTRNPRSPKVSGWVRTAPEVLAQTPTRSCRCYHHRHHLNLDWGRKRLYQSTTSPDQGEQRRSGWSRPRQTLMAQRETIRPGHKPWDPAPPRTPECTARPGMAAGFGGGTGSGTPGGTWRSGPSPA